MGEVVRQNFRNIAIRKAFPVLLLSAWALVCPALFAGNNIAAIYNVSSDFTENIIAVDKSQQLLYVTHCDAAGSPEILKQFRITTGRVDGNKVREGDLKTPEGIYYIISRIPGDELPEKFGPLALVLNYPNDVDRLFRHTGSNIWIHGRNETIKDRQTEGCISLDNSHILDLEPYIKMFKTPVIIVDSLHFVEDRIYSENRKHWDEYLQSWAQAWEEGELDQYFDLYSQFFRDQSGATAQAFRNRKQYLDKLYAWINVDVDKILVISSDEETHIAFRQNYFCPNFYTEGQKQLVLIPENDKWKIVSETFQPSGPRINMDSAIHDFMQTWVSAWESGEIETYIALYDSAFQANKQTRQDWYSDKKEKFARARAIHVKCDDVAISSNSRMTWTVTFRQDYRSDNYRDLGQKTLLIHGYPGQIKILTEEWNSIK